MKKKCNYCEREFDTNEQLEQHTRDKHSNNTAINNSEAIVKKPFKIKRKYIYWAIALLILILIIWAVSRPGAQYTPLTSDGENIKGNGNASITIIEYSDYQCPYCGAFVRDTLPQIEDEYVKTGKAKIIFRNYPLPFYEFAMKAAEAVECAGDQGKFWEMHDEVFTNQHAIAQKNLRNYAEKIGLDTEKFNACLESGAMNSRVKNDLKKGNSDCVSGTPYFIIGNETLNGNQPFNRFKTVIDKQLSA